MSVSLAAEELGVSQSAVSHQVRELTRVLGEQLLVRSGRGIVLSPTGQKLAAKLATTFSSLHSSIDDIVGGGQQVLRLAVCSSFGPGWLIPRLKSFIDGHPGIDLQLQLYAEDPQLTDQVADAIVSALPVEAGYSSIHIVDEMLTAVHVPGKPGTHHRLQFKRLENNSQFGHFSIRLIAQAIVAESPHRSGPRCWGEGSNCFSESDKRRILEEVRQPGAGLAAVARSYGIDGCVLRRWKQELRAMTAPLFVTVEIGAD